MTPQFIRVNTEDGCRWCFNLDQIVKVRISGDPPKVAVEVATGKSFALDRKASGEFLQRFEEICGKETGPRPDSQTAGDENVREGQG